LWWNSTNASACTGNGFTAIGTKGTALVTPSTTTTYSIFCTGSSGTSPTVQATVTVTGTTADTSAPTVVISIPQGGATVSGTIPISAIASDNIGVTKVEFYKDGSLHSTNTVAPYTATWDTTLSPNGSHTLSAKAYDTAGNMGVSSSVVVTVSNSVTPPPDTTAPSIPTGLSGSAVSTSQVNLSWSASTDAVGVAGYNIYRNDTKVAVPAVTTYSDTGLSAATAYGYSVSAYDVAGNTSSTTATVTVTTQSVSPPAVIAIGARVKTMATVNVRNKPSMTKSSKVLGTQSVGALGTVIGGPTVNSGYTWWQVNFDSGKDGWVAANYLVLASTASASITQSLAAGSRGVEVSLLQKILMSLGLFTTDITGYFGPITTAAVIEFQSANNLPPIGIVGPKTRARLQQVANQ
jgi:chitodextrinase